MEGKRKLFIRCTCPMIREVFLRRLEEGHVFILVDRVEQADIEIVFASHARELMDLDSRARPRLLVAIGPICEPVLVAAGVAGYLGLGSQLSDFFDALDAVAEGRKYTHFPDLHRRRLRLNDRQLRILAMLREGMKHPAIAERLTISAETVGYQLKLARESMGFDTDLQLVALAVDEGWI